MWVPFSFFVGLSGCYVGIWLTSSFPGQRERGESYEAHRQEQWVYICWYRWECVGFRKIAAAPIDWDWIITDILIGV